MIKYKHHEYIYSILNELDHNILSQLQVGFGGGTAITLLLSEYRLSTDIDFLCADLESYRELREIFLNKTHRKSLLGNTKEVVEFRSDRYAIRGRLSIADSPPIKVEFVSENRITFDKFEKPLVHAPNIPTLSKIDMFAEKLLANEYRGLDRAFLSRDIIDLAFMIKNWGEIPQQAWDKVDKAYKLNNHFLRRFDISKQMLADPYYLSHCLKGMKINKAHAREILDLLNVEPTEVDDDYSSFNQIMKNK